MGRFVQFFFQPSKRFVVAQSLALVLVLAGCDRLNLRADPKKQLQLGSDRLAARDFRGAVAAYEEALDGTPRTAEAHFRLALIYYDHLQDPVGAEAERKAKVETRTYKVQPGDTLQGISRKYYQTPSRATDILDANMNQLPDESKLKAGMTLIIPD
jgi:nucleoid-associated protein YgaU